MAKDKYDFIEDILSNKKLSPTQKERVLSLTKEEIKKDREAGKGLEERVKVLEEKTGHNLHTDETKKERASNINAKPKDLAEFMSLFNKRDGLKYLTHDFDENRPFKIIEFLKESYEVFNSKTQQLSIHSGIWRITQQFAFDSKQVQWTSINKDFTDKKINLGWASKEWRDWSKKNKLHPIRNKTYAGVITDFKRITRVGKYNSNLKNLINDSISKSFGDSFPDIETKDLEKADFYTHVKSFKDSIDTVFKEIKKYTENLQDSKVVINYEREYGDNYFIRKLIIEHINSYPNKGLDLLIKEWKEKGSMGYIKNKLEGLCHWSVETKIEDKPIRVNILKEVDVPISENIEKAEGFKHIFKFYYK